MFCFVLFVLFVCLFVCLLGKGLFRPFSVTLLDLIVFLAHIDDDRTRRFHLWIFNGICLSERISFLLLFRLFFFSFLSQSPKAQGTHICQLIISIISLVSAADSLACYWRCSGENLSTRKRISFLMMPKSSEMALAIIDAIAIPVIPFSPMNRPWMIS